MKPVPTIVIVLVVREAAKNTKYKGSHQKKNGQSWDFVPTGGREVYPDPNLLTGFLKCSECPETYKKHKKIFLIF